MKSRSKLSASMSLEQFDNGYWYAIELRRFAVEIEIPGAPKLRKDELESAVVHFLKTGKRRAAPKRQMSIKGVRDVERGLTLRRRVAVYTNDPVTKEFIEKEAQKVAPGMKRRSGARYRLNRWRDEQISKGVKIAYGDLVKEYVRLNQSEASFQQIPHGRYINFVSDYFAANEHATQAEIRKAWKHLKRLPMPKTYRAWAKWKTT